MPAELHYAADIGSLCRRREIADGHVLDHTATERAHLGHLGTSCPKDGLLTPSSSQTGGDPHDLSASAAIAASFNPTAQAAPLICQSSASRRQQSRGNPLQDAS